MQRILYIVLAMFCAAVVLSGCGSDDDDNPPPPRVGAVQIDPPPPRVGAVPIDRMARAGVNTALTNPFFRESVPSEESRHETIVDDYNAANDPSQWVAEFSSLIASNLAILDGLDRVCGNQVLAGPTPVAGRYKALADILADDPLYVNTASGTCLQYLAVEANAIGIANTDCGGRTPLENTIDINS